MGTHTFFDRGKSNKSTWPILVHLTPFQWDFIFYLFFFHTITTIKKNNKTKSVEIYLYTYFVCIFVFFLLKYIIYIYVTGIMGTTSRHSFTNSRSLYIHIRSTIWGNAFTAHGRMDTAYSVRTTKRFWNLWMSNINNTAHWASGIFECSWWVVLQKFTYPPTVG